MSCAVIAIDGPAASGKSSVALAVARLVGCRYVNSGAIYRAITWHVLQEGIDPKDARAVEACLAASTLESGFDGFESTFRINGKDATPYLRSAAVNRNVSRISTVPAIRAAILHELLALAGGTEGVVMEGRDIGSVVFPSTPYKFYLDAPPAIRAARRFGQGHKDEIEKRDRIDSSRDAAPLMIAEDAEVIDTSSMSIEEVVEEIYRRLIRLGFPEKRTRHPAST